MTTHTGGPATYLAALGSGGVSAWLSSVEFWMALSVWVLTMAVLIVRLLVDWPKLRARRRRKGGG